MAACLAKKLNIKEGMKVQVIGKPADVDLGDVAVAASSTKKRSPSRMRRSASARLFPHVVQPRTPRARATHTP